MGSRKLLTLDPVARRLHAVGVLLDLASSVALVGWTIALAHAIVAIVERRSPATAVIVLSSLLAARLLSRALANRLLSSASIKVRTAIRTMLVQRWTTGTDRTTTPPTGEAGTLLGSGVDALDEYLTRFLPARSLAAVIPLLVFVIIGVLDPWTLLILLFAGPMLILLLAVIGSRTRDMAVRRFSELGWLRSFHLDMVRGIPTLKIFGRASESVQTIEEVSDRFGRTTMGVLRTAFQTSLVIEWAATAATALVAVQVSFRMIEGHIGYADALAVLMLTPEFFAPLRTLAAEYHSGQAGEAALDRLDEVAAPSPRSTTRVTTTRAPSSIGVIRFESVTFTHPEAREPVLDNASFTIHPGENVVLIGPSGIGKTTVIDLILGLRHPSAGRITVGGRSLDEIDPDDWRGLITSVPQDPFIFRTSLRNNITLSEPGADESEITTALERAYASDFVGQLPGGIDAMIGEEGATLSGGQRQRVAIARATLRDAPLVLLDEFTAHLDPDTERVVIGSMRTFLESRTAVIVAHREATLALADRVLTIVDGAFIEVES